MGMSPVAMTPPPAAQADPNAPPPPAQDAPTAPDQASPAPGNPAPQMNQDSRALIKMVHALMLLGKNRPAAMPGIQQAIEGLKKAMVGLMKESQPPEPVAPPNG